MSVGLTRTTGSGSIFPTAKHLTKVAMLLPQPFRIDVILPYTSVFSPSARNIVTSKIARGVSPPKQS
jgi:hypothetical protein